MLDRDLNRGKGPSQRQLRVGEILRHCLAEIFMRQNINDADLYGVSLTFTEVRFSPDLRSAKVYVFALGGQNNDKIVSALNRHGKYIRGLVARNVKLRFTPQLKFYGDKSFDQARYMDEILRAHIPSENQHLDQDD